MYLSTVTPEKTKSHPPAPYTWVENDPVPRTLHCGRDSRSTQSSRSPQTCLRGRADRAPWPTHIGARYNAPRAVLAHFLGHPSGWVALVGRPHRFGAPAFGLGCGHATKPINLSAGGVKNISKPLPPWPDSAEGIHGTPPKGGGSSHDAPLHCNIPTHYADILKTFLDIPAPRAGHSQDIPEHSGACCAAPNRPYSA